jgi:hypothetical protein
MSFRELVRRWSRKRLTVEELRELAKDHGYMIRPWPKKHWLIVDKVDMSEYGVKSDAACSELHDLPGVSEKHHLNEPDTSPAPPVSIGNSPVCECTECKTNYGITAEYTGIASVTVDGEGNLSDARIFTDQQAEVSGGCGFRRLDEGTK